MRGTLPSVLIFCISFQVDIDARVLRCDKCEAVATVCFPSVGNSE
jgi:hypothetical protein